MDELHNMTALSIAQAIKKEELSALEVTQYFLARAFKYDPALGAFAKITQRRALRDARQADKVLRRTKDKTHLPVFHGVPSAVKDLVPTRGVRTQFGSRAFAFFVPPFNGTVARRMAEGGFISLGKLATSELGVMPITENEVGPPVRNPWCPQRNAGGSSGGSGAAMAAGLIPIAHASDGGGSVRIPAAFCHRYGFKPSLSLLGNLHGKVNRLGLSVMGPIAQTVEDAAAMLDVMAGRPNCGPPQISCLHAAREPAKKMRIGMCTESLVARVESEYSTATVRVAECLASLGHEVVEVPPVDASVEEFLPIWQYMIAQVPVLFEQKLQPITQALRAAGRHITYASAESIRQGLAQRIHDNMETVDLLLTPTTPGPPPLVGSLDNLDDPMAAFFEAAPLGSFTALFNLTLGPAASHPLGFSKAGHPIGIQIGGKPGRDRELLKVCAQLEQALPQFPRYPSKFS